MKMYNGRMDVAQKYEKGIKLYLMAGAEIQGVRLGGLKEFSNLGEGMGYCC